MRFDRNTPSSRLQRRRVTLAATACAAVAIGILGTAGAAPAALPAAAGSSFGVAASTSFVLASEQTVLPAETADAAASQDSLHAGRASVDAAAALSAEVAAAGLDLKGAPASVDTAALEGVLDRLDRLDGPLAVFADGVVDEAAQQQSAVDQQVAALRTAFDTAKAEKAAAEAAAAAAAAAAEAERQAAARPAATSGSFSPPAAPPVAPGSAQEIARGMLAGYGWGDDQFGCLVSLWQKESGWNTQAMNRSSGAYGIPQALPGSKMASAGADWQTNPATQIAWGFGYIANRYGTPCGAWSHSQSVGWY